MSDPKSLEILRSLRVLVLEDDEATRNMLVLYLQTMGHEVSATSTVASARQRLESIRYDVFISDIGLPDGNGWELLQTVKWTYPVYPIATSGYGSEQDRARSQAAGFRHHLLKPCKLSALDAALREAARETAGRAGLLTKESLPVESGKC